MIKLVDLLKEITEGKQVRDILKEITSTSFLEDKILLRFPTVIAKDIKKAFSGVDFYVLAFYEKNFPGGETQKKYINSFQGGGDYDAPVLISKVDYEAVVQRMNPKFASNIKSKLQAQRPVLGNFTGFMYKNLDIEDFKYKADDYFANESSIRDEVHNKIIKIWNGLKSKSIDKFRVEGAYYHVSVNDKLKSGDIIKPYFDSKEYAKIATQGSLGGWQANISFKVTENVLEENRPSNAPSRDKSSYIFKVVDDAIEYLHGGDRPIYAVKATAKVLWVDMKWVDEIQSEIALFSSDRYDDPDPDEEKEYHDTLNEMAKKYWAGKPTEDPVWEGITKNNLEVIKKVRE
jgi:hypothetical protein|tara:strand:- start:1249 stop:2286 length:1038 start_codon:yes stop_codon:yes gene_type:complete